MLAGFPCKPEKPSVAKQLMLILGQFGWGTFDNLPYNPVLNRIVAMGKNIAE
jgi:hypothetical protein